MTREQIALTEIDLKELNNVVVKSMDMLEIHALLTRGGSCTAEDVTVAEKSMYHTMKRASDLINTIGDRMLFGE